MKLLNDDFIWPHIFSATVIKMRGDYRMSPKEKKKYAYLQDLKCLVSDWQVILQV